MLLQYGQTVCTLLDHLKTIFAPQLGQFEMGWVIFRCSPVARENPHSKI
jgi:hypothetical protein